MRFFFTFRGFSGVLWSVGVVLVSPLMSVLYFNVPDLIIFGAVVGVDGG